MRLSEVICPFSGSINSVPPLKSFGVPNEWQGARAMRMVSAPQSPLRDYDCASGSNRHRREKPWSRLPTECSRFR